MADTIWLSVLLERISRQYIDDAGASQSLSIPGDAWIFGGKSTVDDLSCSRMDAAVLQGQSSTCQCI